MGASFASLTLIIESHPIGYAQTSTFHERLHVARLHSDVTAKRSVSNCSCDAVRSVSNPRL